MINRGQATVLVASGLLLLLVYLFPPYHELAKDGPYEHYIGRGFRFNPPAGVAIDCYFVGCITAPASYFRVEIEEPTVVAENITILVVLVPLLWMFRTRRDGRTGTLRKLTTRLASSFLIALLVPLVHWVPIAALLADVPHQLFARDELWLIPVIMVVVLYIGLSMTIFLLLTIGLYLQQKRQRVELEDVASS